MKEAKLTIKEISKNFQLLDSATSYFSNKMWFTCCELWIINWETNFSDDKVYMAKESGTKVMQVLT